MLIDWSSFKKGSMRVCWFGLSCYSLQAFNPPRVLMTLMIRSHCHHRYRGGTELGKTGVIYSICIKRVEKIDHHRTCDLSIASVVESSMAHFVVLSFERDRGSEE